MNKRSKAITVAPKAEIVRRDESTPDELLRLAIEGNVDLDKLERLLQMKREWDREQQRKDFYAALARFQSIVPEMRKNKQVKFRHKLDEGMTEYKYQELADILKHVKEPLGECGLSVQWEQEEKGNEIIVTCLLKHVHGHEERGKPLSGQADNSGKKNLIQQKASTITYLKRYTLIGILGIASSEPDDDGKGGAKTEPSNEAGKIALTDAQVSMAARQILSGQRKFDDVLEKAHVSDAQRKTLETAQKQFDAKKVNTDEKVAG